MEYLLGSIVTLVTLLIIGFLLRGYAKQRDSYRITYSQSYVHAMMSPLTMLFSLEPAREEVETQILKHYDSMFTQVVITKNKAYWIKDNCFFVAPIDQDGEIQKDDAVQVDTMSMNAVQLEEMTLIVEELTRGKGYDSRGTGKS